ncbi:meiotic nuclear division protein 1 [Ochromonadaceae sp. CCMP2298]|nr:meiotic nuclear division protein 1 [Ochromonadaceae sp. CCMP2298]
MSKKRKGLSAEEKCKVILDIYHDKKEPFNLKEMEMLASRGGVVQQTVKDMNQSLVDDFLVFSDKIGSANFFWSFPSKAYQDQLVRKDTLQAAAATVQQSVESLASQVEQARACRQGAGRAQRLRALEGIRAESRACDVQLEGLKGNDPEEIRKAGLAAVGNKASADRWTDNVWTIKAYLVKKKGMSGKEVDKMLHIDGTFDYVEFEPTQPTSKRKG